MFLLFLKSYFIFDLIVLFKKLDPFSVFNYFMQKTWHMKVLFELKYVLIGTEKKKVVDFIIF